MAIMYSCDRCGYKTVDSVPVKRYQVRIGDEATEHECTVDLCDQCLETAWKTIRDQLFRGEKQGV